VQRCGARRQKEWREGTASQDFLIMSVLKRGNDGNSCAHGIMLCGTVQNHIKSNTIITTTLISLSALI